MGPGPGAQGRAGPSPYPCRFTFKSSPPSFPPRPRILPTFVPSIVLKSSPPSLHRPPSTIVIVIVIYRYLSSSLHYRYLSLSTVVVVVASPSIVPKIPNAMAPIYIMYEFSLMPSTPLKRSRAEPSAFLPA